jgi:hypothetical protein
MKRSTLAVALLLVAALFGLQAALERSPAQRLERASQNLGELRASSLLPTSIGSLFLGSFRAVAIDILWIQMHRMGEEQHRYFERVEIMDLITKLQPRNPEAWAYQGWDAAYNIANQFRTEEEVQLLRGAKTDAARDRLKRKIAEKDVQFRKWIRLGLQKLAEGSRHLPEDAYLQYEVGKALWTKASWGPGILEEQFLRAIEEDDELQELLRLGLPPGVRRTAFELAEAWFAKGQATLELLIKEGRFRVYRTLAETMSRPPEEDRRHVTTQMGLNIDIAAFVGFTQQVRFLNGVLHWYRARDAATPEAARALLLKAAECFREAGEQAQLYRDHHSPIQPGMRAYHDARADLCRGLSKFCADQAGMSSPDPAALLARLETIWWPPIDRSAPPEMSAPPADERFVLDYMSGLKRSLGGDSWEYNDERHALSRENLLIAGEEFEATIGPAAGDVDWYHYYLLAPPGTPPEATGLNLSGTFGIRRVSGGPLKVETLGLRSNRPEIAAVDVAGEEEVRFSIPRDREGQVYFRITSPQAGTAYRLKVAAGKP